MIHIIFINENYKSAFSYEKYIIFFRLLLVYPVKKQIRNNNKEEHYV